MNIKQFIKTRFGIGVIIGVLLVFFFAGLDVFVMYSGLFGTIEQYTNGQFPLQWWSIYKTIITFQIIAIGLIYFAFAKRDKSEALAISSIPLILWKTGLADILYFFLQGKMIPSTLPWLWNGQSFPIYQISKLLGFTTVTNVSLFISVVIGIGLAWLIAWILKKKL